MIDFRGYVIILFTIYTLLAVYSKTVDPLQSMFQLHFGDPRLTKNSIVVIALMYILLLLTCLMQGKLTNHIYELVITALILIEMINNR